MLGLILSIATFVILAVSLRALASRRNPTILTFMPENMHGLIVTKSASIVDGKIVGSQGNVVGCVHSIPGIKLDDSDSDPTNWKYVKGKEARGILFYLLGIQFIGLFRYLRINDIRTFRYGRKDEGTKYEVMPKSDLTRPVFFSGQHDLLITNIETTGVLKINLLINLIYEETYPVRVRLRTADPYAVLTMMVTKLVIGIMGGKDPQEFIADEKLQTDLMKKVEKLSRLLETQLGVKIKKASLADISFDEKTEKLLELEKRTELENKAAVAVAEKDKRVGMLINDRDADRVTRVILPAAKDDRTVAVRVAEAYEHNAVVTTFAPGADTMIPLGK